MQAHHAVYLTVYCRTPPWSTGLSGSESDSSNDQILQDFPCMRSATNESLYPTAVRVPTGDKQEFPGTGPGFRTPLGPGQSALER